MVFFRSFLAASRPSWLCLRHPAGVRRSLCASSKGDQLRVAVVGAGPAGFYTARTILKKVEGAQVDVIEMLPTPFGLVRYGVAPDHAETKNAQKEFEQIMDMSGCSFMGGVTVGQDVSLAELRGLYHAVVMAYGASGDASLGIPGENLEGSMSARHLVNWYNGHPHYASMKVDLTAGSRAVVIGNGNVAVDVARVLLKPLDELRKTDMADYALEELSRSKIEEVDIVGRRGPAQAAWTTAELREIVSMSCSVRFREDEMALDPVDEAHVASNRAKKRAMALLNQTLDASRAAESQAGAQKCLNMRFLLSPIEILGTGGLVSSVRMERNLLSGGADKRKATGTGSFEDIPCSLLLRSVGYRSNAIPGLPFDDARHTVPHSAGSVLKAPDGERETGLYVSGWLKRGPSGIIGTNIACGQITAMSLLDDWGAGRLGEGKAGGQALLELLRERGVRVVDLEGWRRIDAYEVERGLVPGRPRVKITSVSDMLDVAQAN